MARFRKKPVEIEAMQWDGTKDDADQVLTWIRANDGVAYLHSNCGGRDSHLLICTLEGDIIASQDWWIIKGIKGEFYPCRNDIFTSSYEAI